MLNHHSSRAGSLFAFCQSQIGRCLLILFGALTLVASGCQQRDNEKLNVARVSGQVLLGGKPLANAKILFVPFRLRGENGKYLPSSFARTDEQGRYELLLESVDTKTTDQKGAAAGRHWVLISTKQMTPQVKEPEQSEIDDDSDDDKESGAATPKQEGEPSQLKRPVVIKEEKVADRFNGATRLIFNVPNGGTNQADFHLPVD